MRFALARRWRRWRPVRARAHGRGAERRSAGRAHQQGRLCGRQGGAAAQAVLAQRPAVVLAGAGAGRRSSGWAGRLTDLLLAGSATSGMAGVTAGGNTVLLAGRHSSGYRVGPRDRPPSTCCATGSTARSLHRAAARPDRRATPASDGKRAGGHRPALDRHGRAPARCAGHRAAAAQLRRRRYAAGGAAAHRGRIIAARRPLGARRQVFFVSQNGYDNHTGLRDDHPALLRELGRALAAFQAELDRMGMADQVTTFTASEFGRTLGSNGNGSDHGWGGHHLVLGGAVRGGRCYGAHPDIALDGPGFVDNGRLAGHGGGTAGRRAGRVVRRWPRRTGARLSQSVALRPRARGLLPAPDRAA